LVLKLINVSGPHPQHANVLHVNAKNADNTDVKLTAFGEVSTKFSTAVAANQVDT
jgi:hypothetical protein